MDITQKGLTGEFYVLAQLTSRGFNASLTLGNTKGVDILVMNDNNNIGYKVEVKTSAKKRGPKAKRPLSWILSKKNETNFSDNLIYCFVQLFDSDTMPKFFLVHSKVVSDFITNDHQSWLDRPGAKGNKHNDSSMRKFKIDLDDPHGYENNWKLLDL